MIRLSDIWDGALDALRARGRLLAAIAALLVFLPGIVQNAVADFWGERRGAVALLILLVTFAALVLALWANLSLVAAVDEPAVSRVGPALRLARPRVPLFLGLATILGVAVAVLMIPPLAILFSSMVDPAAIGRADPADPLGAFHAPSAGAVLGSLFLFLVLVVLLLWVGARLLVLSPVILHERRGLGSFARCFRLTRGLALRLIGFLLLAAITFGVTAIAIQLIVGVTTRLLLGPAGVTTAIFIAQLAVGAVSAAFVVVMATFAAQLYRALTARQAAQALA